MVQERIRSIHQDLPPNQKVLAEFILDHLEEIPFWNVHTLAKEADTSTASVVRLAQRLGYSGYPALREEVVNRLKSDLNQDYVSRVQTLEGDVLSMVANQDLQDINDTLNHLNRGDFHTAVDLILKAKRVHIAGVGISNLLSDLLAYQLYQVGVKASAVQAGPLSFLEQAAFFEPSDLLLGFIEKPIAILPILCRDGRNGGGLGRDLV